MNPTEIIREKLFSMQDPAYKRFQAALIPNIAPETIIGVRTPVLRKYAKELAGTPEAERFLVTLPHAYYEENNLHGLLLEGMSYPSPLIPALDTFLPYIDNWATCDLIVPKSFRKHPPELIQKIEQWIVSGHTYTIRFGIGMLMRFYLDETFSSAYPEMVAQIHSNEYYVNMMAAWYFATALAKQYDAIADLRALYQGENVTITEDWTISGTVISNYRHAKSGGLNNATSQKTVVIQDETAGISMFLVENNEDLALGDRVEVKVNGLTLQRYQNGSLQIDAVPMDRITKLSGGSQVEPKTISAADLVTGEYESQYVAVTDVQVVDSDLGKTFVTQDSEGKDRHTSINFISRTGVKFLLFSSSYSTFGDELVPEGSGTLKGIAVVHGGDYQISITSTDDYADLTGERFDDSGFERPQPTKATIEELLAAPVSGSVWYEITGTISDIESTVYGNFTITDETGSIYVYGLTSEWQADGQNDKSFSELGLKEGDVLTLAGTRDVYNDEPQIGGPAYYISHEEGQGGGDEPDDPTVKEVTIEEFIAAEVSDNVWYQLTGTILSIDNDNYGNITIQDETGSVYVYGLTKTKVDKNDNSFSSIGLSEGDIVTLVGTRDEYNGEAQVGGPAYYISHEEGELPDNPGLIEGTAGDGVYEGNIDLSKPSVVSTDDKCVASKFVIDGSKEVIGMKLGTSSVAGAYSFNLGKTGSATLTMYAIAWNNNKTHALVKITGGGTINGLSEVELDCQTNTGLANNEPFNITFGSNDFYTMNIEGATSSTVITVTTEGMSKKRVAFLGVNVK